jgi:hypothetical protein
MRAGKVLGAERNPRFRKPVCVIQVCECVQLNGPIPKRAFDARAQVTGQACRLIGIPIDDFLVEIVRYGLHVP